MAESQVRCQSSMEGWPEEAKDWAMRLLKKELPEPRAMTAPAARAVEARNSRRLAGCAECMEGAREAGRWETAGLVRGGAVFLRRGGEEDCGQKDDGDEGNDEERGRQAHDQNSLTRG